MIKMANDDATGPWMDNMTNPDQLLILDTFRNAAHNNINFLCSMIFLDGQLVS